MTGAVTMDGHGHVLADLPFQRNIWSGRSCQGTHGVRHAMPGNIMFINPVSCGGGINNYIK
ncbi:hypothetical protein C3920_04355 [Novacetimonas pomaceti]|uniref:Uncharacterized protein n=1 Tax=Novacetimonas pomaceti TaxID=2021998 RepID=A0ABX5P431_9PROT|nr:hypothetical protein C3920_04355 [Novacetimonas pomaceti]